MQKSAFVAVGTGFPVQDVVTNAVWNFAVRVADELLLVLLATRLVFILWLGVLLLQCVPILFR